MIYEAKDEDAEAIEDLELQLFDNALNAYSIRRELANGLGIVCRGRTTLCGYALIRLEEDLADLTRLAVAPAEQGRGIGKLLLTTALRMIGTRSMMLTVKQNNEPALHLYKSMGFQVWSWLPQAGAIVMRVRR